MNIQKRIVNGNNWMAGRNGYGVNTIVIHTEVGNQDGSEARFNNPNSQVSVHYGVGQDGNIRQWVEESDTAYNCGNWDMNLKSIGIEHEDFGDYNGTRPDSLYNASSDLVADICRRYGIACDRGSIKGHNEVIDRLRYPGGTGCPDGLDIDRIVREAHAKLNGEAPAPTPEAQPVASGDHIHLPAEATQWRIYALNAVPRVGNEVAFLRPSLFGGLDYDVLAWPYPNVATIQTRDYGQVNIYVGADTGASVSTNAPAPVEAPTPTPTPAPEPAQTVTVTPPVDTPATITVTTSSDPVTLAVPADFRDSFKAINGTFKAKRNVVVKDLYGNAPDQLLGKNQTIIRGGTFTKDGKEYTRTAKSVNTGIWYGIPSDALSQSSNPGKYMSRLISDIKAKPNKFYDEIDHIVHEVATDPTFKQVVVPLYDKRERRLAKIGHTEDKFIMFFSKLNIFNSNKNKGA